MYNGPERVLCSRKADWTGLGCDLQTTVVLALLSHQDAPCVAETPNAAKCCQRESASRKEKAGRASLRLTRERSVPPCQGAWGLSPVRVCCGDH